VGQTGISWRLVPDCETGFCASMNKCWWIAAVELPSDTMSVPVRTAAHSDHLLTTAAGSRVPESLRLRCWHSNNCCMQTACTALAGVDEYKMTDKRDRQ